MSFRDCLPEEGVPVPGVCQLNYKSALMIVLSLATSAAYFGCTHRIVRWILRSSVPRKLAFQNAVGRADKVVQIPRIVELWREAKELEDRRLLCGRDGNINEMAMLATLRPSVTSGRSNATESVPCVLQVRGCALGLRRANRNGTAFDRRNTGKMLARAGLIADVLSCCAQDAPSNTQRASAMRRQQTAFIAHEEPALSCGW
jgi:hypothetical protein